MDVYGVYRSRFNRSISEEGCGQWEKQDESLIKISFNQRKLNVGCRRDEIVEDLYDSTETKYCDEVRKMPAGKVFVHKLKNGSYIVVSQDNPKINTIESAKEMTDDEMSL